MQSQHLDNLVAEVRVPQWTTEKVNKNEKSSVITVKRDSIKIQI